MMLRSLFLAGMRQPDEREAIKKNESNLTKPDVLTCRAENLVFATGEVNPRQPWRVNELSQMASQGPLF